MVKQKFPPRIMYIEYKGDGLHGSARIGRVTFTRTGATLHYGGRSFGRLGGRGFKANYSEIETGEEYWISGPRKDGTDRLYKSDWPVEIDEDVREEYWTDISQKTRTEGSQNDLVIDNKTTECNIAYAPVSAL